MEKIKDNRYEALNALLTSGRIKSFSEIFDYIPKSVVRKSLKTNNNRITSLMFNPAGFTFEEIKTLSDLMNYNFKALALLVADSI